MRDGATVLRGSFCAGRPAASAAGIGFCMAAFVRAALAAFAAGEWRRLCGAFFLYVLRRGSRHNRSRFETCVHFRYVLCNYCAEI